MKALVTGDRGFLGSHFVNFLKEEGWEVYGLDIVDGVDAVKFFKDPDDEYFDLIVHCAYEVGGRAHIDGSNMALSTNVELDAGLFKWALETRQGAVIYFSSSAAYPKRYQSQQYINDTLLNDWNADLRLNEDDIYLDTPMAPDANYGWAKLTGEKIAQQASHQGLRVHVFRPFSGYSHLQSNQYPFPAIVNRARKGDLTVWGPAGQTRDWIHVEDILRGCYQVYLNDERRPVNVCTGIPTTMGDLAYIAYGSFSKPVKYLTDKPTGVFYRVGCPARFNEHYIPKISIEEGVKMALDYYR